MNAVARIEEMESSLTPLGAEMVGALGVEAQVAFGELTLVAGRERIVEVLTVLRDRFGFQQLLDICGVDFPDREERFEVVYHLLSLTRNARIRVKVTSGLCPNTTYHFRHPFGTEVFTTSPAELAKFQTAESQKWGRIVKAAGIEAE